MVKKKIPVAAFFGNPIPKPPVYTRITAFTTFALSSMH